jgi:hypothetical protein
MLRRAPPPGAPPRPFIVQSARGDQAAHALSEWARSAATPFHGVSFAKIVSSLTDETIWLKL